MNTANLILHCGSAKVEREQLALVKTPEATDTWQPIGHLDLLSQVERALGSSSLQIVSQAHGLSKDGARYFGLLQIAKQDSVERISKGQKLGFDSLTVQSEYGYVLGLRNSHDKRFPAGLVLGSSIFVCDNLSFSGEVSVTRKHTTFINRDLPGLTARAIGQLGAKWHDQEVRFDAYKKHEISNPQAHDILIRALDCRAVTATQIPHILKEWRHPRHAEFAKDGLTAWRLFNAVTEVGKDAGVWSLPSRTIAFHGLLDQECGLAGLN
jgi:hypothetical protein